MATTGQIICDKSGQIYGRRIAKCTKHPLTLGSEGRTAIRLLTATVVGGYRAPAESLTAMTHSTNATKVLRFSTPTRLYL